MKTLKCGFKWEDDDDEDGLHHLCQCIRRPGHEGNHVSFPSGLERPQAPQKELIDKTKDYANN